MKRFNKRENEFFKDDTCLINHLLAGFVNSDSFRIPNFLYLGEVAVPSGFVL